MKKIILAVFLFALFLNLTGCEGLAKKFRRKKKEAPKAPRIYQIKKYDKTPSPELYKKHYAYWMSWHSELIKVLGQNHKKDARCIEEIMGNLKDMENILVEESAGKLAAHVAKLERVKDAIYREELTDANKDEVRRTLEREERAIKREFSYIKIKDCIKKSFDEDVQQ